MDVRIEKQPAFSVIGPCWTVSTKNGENYRVIPEFWDQAMENGTFSTLHESAKRGGLFQGAVLGVCFNFNDEQERFDYMIAVESDADTQIGDWSAQQFSSQTYAIFKNQGSPLPKAIQATFRYIYEEWFPSSEHKPGEGPEVEVYFENDAFEIWIPLQT